MKFRKKPVVIDAWRTSALIRQAAKSLASDKMPVPILIEYDRGNLLFLSEGIDIKTLEGWMHADLTDWVICGVKGELYPCKPDIFEATYEKVEE